MESFATAAPSSAPENVRPRTAMSAFGRTSAFRLPRHIRYSSEFVALIEMRATFSATTPFYQVSTMAPDDLSLVAEFFSLFLKIASVTHVFSDPHCAQLDTPAPTLSLILMYGCLLEETISCALRIEILAKVRGSIDFVVSEISSHPFSDNALQVMRRHLDSVHQIVGLSHPDRERYVLSQLCLKYHRANAADVHLAHVHRSTMAAGSILAALQAMDLPQQVISAYRPPTWDALMSVEAAQALILPLPTICASRQFTRTLQQVFLADMSRRQIFCSAPTIPCPFTQTDAPPASQRPAAPRDHPKHPSTRRDKRDHKRSTHRAAKAAKPRPSPRNPRQPEDVRA